MSQHKVLSQIKFLVAFNWAFFLWSNQKFNRDIPSRKSRGIPSIFVSTWVHLAGRWNNNLNTCCFPTCNAQNTWALTEIENFSHDGFVLFLFAGWSNFQFDFRRKFTGLGCFLLKWAVLEVEYLVIFDVCSMIILPSMEMTHFQSTAKKLNHRNFHSSPPPHVHIFQKFYSIGRISWR